ncbi:MAG: cobalt ECF transporter T component CbiQ [Pseudonocardia sp.]|nr:cobalt ECF transporter T component CbiQ [Pseudonocardia sp.]
MLPLDAGAYASRWRSRHPGEKALLALGLLVTAVVLPPWPGAALCGTAALVLLLGPAGVGARITWHAVQVPLGFVLLGAVPLLVTVGGDPWLAANPAGLVPAAELTGRAVAALLCLILFAATTPLADIVPRLTRLGVPPAITEIASLIYRLLFLLLDSARAVREAQATRLGFRTWRTSYQSLAGQRFQLRYVRRIHRRLVHPRADDPADSPDGDRTAFFTAEADDHGQRVGKLVEFDATATIFGGPSDVRTEDYISGRFG